VLDALAIIAIVERGKADHIVNKAKEAGALGATIFHGRGTGEKEAQKLLHIRVESSKETIVILAKTDDYKAIFNEMVAAGNLKAPGTGIIFTVKVSDLVGLHQRDDHVFDP